MKQPAIVRAGLDVGARELVVALRRDGVLEPTITLPSTPAGHRQLLKLLTRRGASARLCLEATGVYSLRLALALHRAERVEVMVVNPRAIKDFERARLTRAKTDEEEEGNREAGGWASSARCAGHPRVPPAHGVRAVDATRRRRPGLAATVAAGWFSCAGN